MARVYDLDGILWITFLFDIQSLQDSGTCNAPQLLVMKGEKDRSITKSKRTNVANVISKNEKEMSI